MSRTRAEALRALIAYEQPIEPILGELREFGWDAPEPIETLHRADIVAMIDRYLTGSITSEQLTDWADLLECRDDIGFRPNEKRLLSDAIFRLANPNLREIVTPEIARALKGDLLNEQSAI